MMRKFTVCLVLCATGLFVSSCNDDVSSPPKSTLAVSANSGVITADPLTTTEFTFTVDQVSGAGTISLLPYGTANASLGGIIIPAASFTGGKATVKFKYAQVGSFDAVVVTNNHSSDGASVKNSYSNTVHVDVTSPEDKITEFTFDKISTKTTIDQGAKTIVVEVPYKTTLTALKATFINSTFSKVTVGGAAQSSGSTANDFTTPKTYTVTAADGTSKTDYDVSVVVTPINNTFTFKSFSAKEMDGTAMGSALATSGTDIVFYDVYDTPADDLDSLKFGYVLDNPFGVVHNVIAGVPVVDKMDQDTAIKLNGKVNVLGQDSVVHPYIIHAVAAPLLMLASDVPTTVDVNTKFSILIKALKGTVLDSKLDLTFDVTNLGVYTVNSITLKDIDHLAGATFNNGDHSIINFSDAVTIILNVTGGGLTFDVTYTAGLTELK